MKNKCCNFFWLLLFTLLYVSCVNNNGHPSTDTVNNKTKNDVRRKPPGSFSDTVVINFPAAVFYTPDSLQLEKIKAVTDSMIFDSNMHDCFYQMRYSRIVLKKNWPAIKIIEIKNAGYILFKHSDGGHETIDLNSQNDPCGIFLFDGHKKPQLADMTNIETDLGFYFSK